jgi:dipeptidase D
MSEQLNVAPERVFYYFGEICKIPHGSGNMSQIASFCESFAKEHCLNYIRDEHDNIVIFKPASEGKEGVAPIILQGHLDMVCQKTEDSDIDFLRDGLKLYVDGDFLKAKGTTLGADNGIAVAMIMSILASDDIPHPPIEAVFTTDEEIGLIGASALDKSLLSAKKMINLDSEDMDIITVSCAGGSDFEAIVPFKRAKMSGTKVTISIDGLKGGHSGVMINCGRVNADILGARILNQLNILSMTDLENSFELISINGGDKGNAIPLKCEIELCAKNPEKLKNAAEKYIEIIKSEISHREPQFEATVTIGETGEFLAIADIKDEVIRTILCIPNGVMEMSSEIEGLVETSLNLGILKTEKEKIILASALRSNKKSALKFLEEKMVAYFSNIPCQIKTGGHYPPWEFNPNSELVEIYKEHFQKEFGFEPAVEAIHAGLECGIFAEKINNFDCISVGPKALDIHTVNERLSISSTEALYKLLLKILASCK